MSKKEINSEPKKIWSSENKNSEFFNKFFPKEKMDVILDKFKNKEKQ